MGEFYNIDIDSNGSGYKSIKSIKWNNVPDFAIITGKNGSGKTQFLEIISYRLTGTRPHQDNIDAKLTLSGISIDGDEIGFVPSSGRFAGGGGASLAQMQNLRQSIYQQSQQKGSYIHDPAQMSRAIRFTKLIGARNWAQLTENGQKSLDEDEFTSFLVDVDVASNLATVFIAHRLKLVEALERGTPGISKDGKELGPAPWDVVNESLKVAGFPYEVTIPTEVGLLDHYQLKLKDIKSGNRIDPSDLSSGEQVLLQLNLWLFSSSKDGVFPKLLLLDEPDAHLHPSMTNQFLDVVSEVLVRKHGVRVIMTTHSPSTVALAPEGSVFQIMRGEAEIRPVTDRAAIISVLTAGLITVSPATRFCFVEDEDDVTFYSAVHEILTDVGPSKDPCAIRSSPSLVFIAASVGRGAQKIPGGKGIVEKWIEKLDAPPLTSSFQGVIDRDTSNTPSQRIKVIGRYSFENYLLDPINIFGLLLENGMAPYVEGLNLSIGDEHLLRGIESNILQKISNSITERVEATFSFLSGQPLGLVQYTRGQCISVPKWVMDHRGHDLLQYYQKIWGGNNIIIYKRLINSLRRVRLLPIDIAILYKDLQGGSN